jgi:hypothetical protein
MDVQKSCNAATGFPGIPSSKGAETSAFVLFRQKFIEVKLNKSEFFGFMVITVILTIFPGDNVDNDQKLHSSP